MADKSQTGEFEGEYGLLDTDLMGRWRNGDPEIKRQVDALIYGELRRLANTYMSRERKGHTLQATALVHEAFTKVIGRRYGFIDKHHFYATAAKIMRQVLVDYAKARNATKRGGGVQIALSTQEDGPVGTDGGIDMVELDDALARLEELSLEAARGIELHYFAGLTLPETAKVMGTSVSSVSRQIRFGKAWLLAQLKGSAPRTRKE